MSETKITVKPNAPYKIEGDFNIEYEGNGSEGKGSVGIYGRISTDGKPTYLCSCGHSQKKPFCDGSHTKCETKTS